MKPLFSAPATAARAPRPPLLSTSLRFEARNYQVTGPVLEITPTIITVQKGAERWELARNKDTKVKGDLKVGAKVTIYYQMVAQGVEVKEAGKAKK